MTENRLYELRATGRNYILSHIFDALELTDELVEKLTESEERYIREYINELVDGLEWEMENMIE